MGRKATFYLLHLILLVVTFILSALLILGFFSSKIIPTEHWIFSLLGMGMMVVVFVNFILLIYWAVKRKIWFAVPLVALCLNYGFLLSMFQIHSVDTSKYDVKIATYNIHGFRGAQYSLQMKDIAHEMVMEDVGVVCMQEFILNNKYPMDSIKTLFGAYKYSFLPTDGTYNPGVAVFSHYPIVNTGYLTFEDTDKSALWVDIDVKGKIIRVMDAHLQTTNFNQSGYELAELKNGFMLDSVKIQTFNTLIDRVMRNDAKRLQQIEKILTVADTTKHPLIICGDWNSTPASYIYEKMSKKFSDGFKTCGNGYEYTYRGFFNMMRIDYIMYEGVKGESYYSLDETFSDHNPVLFGFSFRD